MYNRHMDDYGQQYINYDTNDRWQQGSEGVILSIHFLSDIFQGHGSKMSDVVYSCSTFDLFGIFEVLQGGLINVLANGDKRN